MKIALIVLNYNDYVTTSKYINFIKNYSVIDNVIVVDNCSTDNSYEKLKIYESDKIDVIKSDKNGGYAYGNNYGIRYSKEKYNPDYLIISNPDVFFEENVISKMIEVINNNENIGIVSPKLINRNNLKDAKAWKLPNYWMNICKLSIILNKLFAQYLKYDDNYFDEGISKVDVIPGSFFMIKSDVFYEINLFDEGTFLYGEENIIAYKLKEIGYKNLVINNCIFYHEHSTTINKTFNSNVHKYNILYRSLDYYNKNYLKTNFIYNTVFWIMWKITSFEKVIIGLFKSKKGREI